MDDRFICHMATLIVVALLIEFMAWKGGKNDGK